METVDILELGVFLREFSELQPLGDEFCNFSLSEDLTQEEYDLLSCFDGGRP